MPLLAQIAGEFAQRCPFQGRTIGVSLHIEPKTAVLLDVLAAGGARVVAAGNLGTTQSETVAALNERGIEAFGDRNDDHEAHLSHVATVAAARPDLLLDNGADLVTASLEIGHSPAGGTEETTSGAFRLRDELLDQITFPMIVINDSPLKAIVENKHAVGQSVIESFMRITNLMIQGKRMVVVGYGWCGRGIAHYARSFGAELMVVERDEIKALEAAVDGFRVAGLLQAARWGNVFVTATGAQRVIDAEVLSEIADGAILANAGHFDTEIDVPALRRAATVVHEPTEGIEALTMAGGRTLTLLAGGRMLNLAGPGSKGNSIEAMDLGFALQALSLELLASASRSVEPGPQPVPDAINRHVATAMVSELMGR